METFKRLPPLHATPPPKTFELPLVKMQSIFTRGEERLRYAKAYEGNNGLKMDKVWCGGCAKFVVKARGLSMLKFDSVRLPRFKREVLDFG